MASLDIFRIFVSSTFSDMVEERNALHERAFPRLRALCSEHGARFQAVDLRWGISDEAGQDQQTMKICLEEIARCQQMTRYPNFIVLLGDRYGWQPLPCEIAQDEFDDVAAHVADDADMALLAEWYLLDENAVPPACVLKPREGEFSAQDAWSHIERRLHRILENASSHLPVDRRLKYATSATEQEIQQGIFAVLDAATSALCFFRTVPNLPHDVDGSGYIDLEDDGRLDTIAQARLSDLKQRLHGRLPGNIYEYEVHWQRGKISIDHLNRLCEDAYARLSAIIMAELETRSLHANPNEEEIATHVHFGQNRARSFVGRAEMIERMGAYLAAPTGKPLVVYGKSGIGKTTVMARITQQVQAGFPQAISVCRFIGVTPRSYDIRALLESLCGQIAARYGVNMAISTGYYELVDTFAILLASASADKPLIIMLDALDQLSSLQDGQQLDWLPIDLPGHVSLIVSTQLGDVLDTLRVKFGAGDLIEIQPMSVGEGRALLRVWLGEAGRTLQPSQEAEVLRPFEANGSPLYLLLAFEEARRWRSYTADVMLGPDIPGITKDNLFRRLADNANHGPMLVSHVLAYLVAARNGMTESELLDLLTLDEAFWEEFLKKAHHQPPLRQLPFALWARLHADLTPYLSERLVDGVNLLTFFHRQFIEIIRDNYLTRSNRKHFHGLLADYFEKQRLWTGADHALQPNLRKLSELVYQLHGADRYESIRKLFDTHEWLHARYLGSGNLYSDYLDDLWIAWEQIAHRRAEDDTEALGDCVRFALIRTSLNSQASAYDPLLVVRAAELGLWTLRQAFDLVSRMPGSLLKVDLYIKLLAFSLPQQTWRKDMIAVALQTARELPDDSMRVNCLVKLAPFVGREELKRVLQEVAQIEPKSIFAAAIGRLAPLLPEEFADMALESAIKTTMLLSETRSSPILALIPYLSEKALPIALDAMIKMVAWDWKSGGRLVTDVLNNPHLLEQRRDKVLAAAFEATRVITSLYYRVEKLIGLIPYTRGELQQKALASALDTVQKMPAEKWTENYCTEMSLALASLAPHLDEESRGVVLQFTMSMRWDGHRAEALEKLAPYLSQSQLDIAMQAVLAMEDRTSQMKAVKALGAFLNQAQFDIALQCVLALEPEDRRVNMLVEIAPHLRGAQLHSALDAARRLGKEQAIAQMIERAAQHLIENLLNTAFEMTLALTQEAVRLVALLSLIPYLSGTYHEQAVATAVDILYSRPRLLMSGANEKSLTVLLPQLNSQQLDIIVETACAIKQKSERLDTLVVLLPYLAEKSREQAVAAAMDALRGSPEMIGQGFHEKSLAALLPHLTGEQLEDVLETALALNWDKRRVDVLVTLLPYLSGESRERVLNTTLQVIRSTTVGYDEEWRSQTLAALSPYLDHDQRTTAIEAGLAISYNEKFRVLALAALVSQTDGEQADSILEAARSLKDEQGRAEILTASAPYLNGESVNRALEIARTITNEQKQATAVASLVQHLNEDQLLAALQDIRMKGDEPKRIEALASLAPYLNANQLDHTLQIVQKDKEHDHSLKILTSLASCLRGKQIRIALEILWVARRSWAYDEYALKILTIMGPYLRGSETITVIRIASADKWDKDCLEVLKGLVPYTHGIARVLLFTYALIMALPLRVKASWEESLDTLYYGAGEEQRPDLQEKEDTKPSVHSVSRLIPALKREESREKALASILSVVEVPSHDVGSEETLAYIIREIAPYLNEQQLNTVLQSATLFIWQDIYRAKALISLAPYLPSYRRKTALTDALRAVEKMGWKFVDHKENPLNSLSVQPSVQEFWTLLYSTTRWDDYLEVFGQLVPCLDATERQIILHMVQQMDDETKRVQIFKALKPYLDSSQKSTMLYVVRKLKDNYLRAQMLIELYPAMSPYTDSLINEIRAAMANYLLDLKNENREKVLEFCADARLFTLPMLEKDVLTGVADSIIDVCWKWEWLVRTSPPNRA